MPCQENANLNLDNATVVCSRSKIGYGLLEAVTLTLFSLLSIRVMLNNYGYL